MSLPEILQALEQLTAAERREVRVRLDQLEGAPLDEWDDDGELTDMEKVLINRRVLLLAQNISQPLPWAAAEEELRARHGP